MATEDQKQRFGAALAEERRATGLSFAILGKAISRTGSAVQQWETGQTEPDPDTVFRLERFLELPSGRLSRHLGYVQVGDTDGPADIIALLQRDGRLDERGRENLIALYRREATNTRRERGSVDQALQSSADAFALAASGEPGADPEEARDIVESVLELNTGDE